MRILHTSDWHLGRTFHGRALDDAHAAFADHLVGLVRTEGVDAVLVAGDVYDRAVPPTDSVRLLDETLRRLSERTRVVLTPGNHDSARRLGFAAGLLREGLVIRARTDAVHHAVVLPDADGGPGALVYALPYLDPDAARATLPRLLAEQLGERSEDGGPAAGDGEPQPPRLARSHEAVVSGALRLVAADLAARRAASPVRTPALVMAHAFVAPARTSEDGSLSPAKDAPATTQSERDIRVGGVDLVPSQVFATLGGSPLAAQAGGLDYVALGHLHRPQAVHLPEALHAQDRPVDTVLPVLRYCGSPLPFSFSEAPCAKSSVLIDVGACGVSSTELVPAPAPHRIETVRATMAELLSPRYDELTDAWLRVELTGELPHGALARLKQRFTHMLSFSRIAPTARPHERVVITRQADPVKVSEQFLAEVGGREPSPAESAVLSEAYEAVRAAERSL
ncbi:exonuclease SbcCD subunit D [Actinomyces gaoshouyii]|uniref:exonuclease SbcCD subunit D n=1 Tax=Actinomyces gaoshouyii TaxID=1960083 RepID=UPI0009BD0FF0|nr:exonuclease SbcCD subunit D [Actinomyces gaoshouyii]ARD42201.1 exonuclease SbcCD subunit D [Actinomyces gaoshouyii]